MEATSQEKATAAEIARIERAIEALTTQAEGLERSTSPEHQGMAADRREQIASHHRHLDQLWEQLASL